MPQCEVTGGWHRYLADSERLWVIRCSHCGVTKTIATDRNKNYFRCRRRAREDLSLWSVSVSFSQEEDFCSQLRQVQGLHSNKVGYHVTLSDSLFAETRIDAVVEIQEALLVPSQPGGNGTECAEFQVSAVETKISASDKTKVMFLLQLQLSNKLSRDALEAIAKAHGALPTLPPHVTVGTAKRSDQGKVRKQLTNLFLGTRWTINAESLECLGPPTEEQRQNFKQHIMTKKKKKTKKKRAASS